MSAFSRFITAVPGTVVVACTKPGTAKSPLLNEVEIARMWARIAAPPTESFSLRCSSDAAAVSEWLENVLRRVLIHSHRGFAPLLESGERGIGCGGVVASGASEERGEPERRETEGLHAQ